MKRNAERKIKEVWSITERKFKDNFINRINMYNRRLK